MKVQSGASPLPGCVPLTANPEDKEWVPCPVPKGEETKGLSVLFCLGNCTALIQLPVFAGLSKPHALKISAGSYPSSVQAHVVQTQTGRMLASHHSLSVAESAIQGLQRHEVEASKKYHELPYKRCCIQE